MRTRAVALLCLLCFAAADAAVIPTAADARCKSIYCIPSAKKTKKRTVKKKRVVKKKRAVKKKTSHRRHAHR